MRASLATRSLTTVWLWTTASLCALSLLQPACARAREVGDRPNIVMIISDDQTYTDFGFMGNTDVLTPRLDMLARQSAVYPNGYVPSSVCRPSLVTLLTGLYPHQHLIHFNHPPPGFSKLTRSVGHRQENDSMNFENELPA